MVKRGSKAIFILAAVITLCTCIDPYTPMLTGYESLLVIDDYASPGEREGRIADYRNTLYWKPTLKVNQTTAVLTKNLSKKEPK